MRRYGENIYQKCRQDAGLTIPQAAKLLNVGERTISHYEAYDFGKGKGVLPPEDIVLKMVDVYGTFEVAYRHMSENTLLGREFMPKVDFSEDLALSFLRQRNEWEDLSDETILEQLEQAIMNDNEITADESNMVEPYRKELLEMIYTSLTLVFRIQKNSPLQRAV